MLFQSTQIVYLARMSGDFQLKVSALGDQMLSSILHWHIHTHVHIYMHACMHAHTISINKWNSGIVCILLLSLHMKGWEMKATLPHSNTHRTVYIIKCIDQGVLLWWNLFRENKILNLILIAGTISVQLLPMTSVGLCLTTPHVQGGSRQMEFHILFLLMS